MSERRDMGVGCRSSIALLVGIVACASPRARTRSPAAGGMDEPATSRDRAARVSPARSCGPTPALQRFDVPEFALSHGAYAAELGGAVVIMHVGSSSQGQRAQAGQPLEFHGAMYELASRTWVEIPPPPASVLSGGVDREAHFVAAGERVAMLLYSLSPPRFGGEVSTTTAIFDTLSRGWKVVAQDDAPPPEAYLTGPYRAQSTDRFWVWWPSHEQGTNYAGGYALDMARAQWIRTSPAGAPSVRSYSRPQQLPDGRLLVIPNSSAEAGIYDPASNRWEPFEVPVSEHGYEAVAVSDDGRVAAILHFVEVQDRKRRIAAFLLDLSTKAVDALPAPDALIGYYPNAEMLHVDADRIVLVNEMSAYVFDRKRRRWSVIDAPFENPVTNSGSFHHLCGNRILIGREPWLLHLDDLSWHPLRWPEGVRQRARHMLYASDHMVLVGDRRTETEDNSRCPPGAPCMAPTTRSVEVTESFLVPLESGPGAGP